MNYENRRINKKFVWTGHHARLTQYSDEGRVPLGRYNDAENSKIKNLILNTVSDDTLKIWEDLAHKNMFEFEKLMTTTEPFDHSKASYPLKIKSSQGIEYDSDNETDNQPTTSTNQYSKTFIINRKFGAEESCSDDPIVQVSSEVNDENNEDVDEIRVVIDDDVPEKEVVDDAARRKNARNQLASIIQRKARQECVLGENITESTNTASPQEVQNCVFHKYGHCWNRQHCQFAHNGIVSRSPSYRSREIKKWERKDSSVNLCPGYLVQSCWNMSCPLRHVLYSTDNIDN